MGLCWVILGLKWAFVGSFGALLAAFEPKISTPTEEWFGWGWILGRFRACAGPFGGYIGTLLCHLKAIYVGIPSLTLANEWELRHLCPKKAAWCWEKNMGRNRRRRLQKYVIFRDIDGSTDLFLRELSHLSPIFWHKWRNSRFWAIYF